MVIILAFKFTGCHVETGRLEVDSLGERRNLASSFRWDHSHKWWPETTTRDLSLLFWGKNGLKQCLGTVKQDRQNDLKSFYKTILTGIIRRSITFLHWYSVGVNHNFSQNIEQNMNLCQWFLPFIIFHWALLFCVVFRRNNASNIQQCEVDCVYQGNHVLI